jgi:hypothetical protein
MSDNAPAPAQSLPSVLFATAQLPIIRERSRATAVNQVGSGMTRCGPARIRMNIRTIKAEIILLFIEFFAIVTLAATTERTVYSQTSNKELKQKSIQLVKNVRSLVDSYKKQDRELMAQYDKKDRSEMSKGSAHASRQQWLKDSDLTHDSTMRYYKDHYWADAILLIRE